MNLVNVDFAALEKYAADNPVATARASLIMQGIEHTEVSKGVFKVETQYGATMYYPKHAKWIHRGKTRKGDLQAFSGWVQPLLITGD